MPRPLTFQIRNAGARAEGATMQGDDTLVADPAAKNQ